MMLRTCLTKMTAMTSSRGTSQQTAALLAVVTTGTFRKRLVDRLPTEISGGQGMGMPEGVESRVSLLYTVQQVCFHCVLIL